MHMKRLVGSILVAVFLSGCSLAPAYRQPDAPVPDQWPGRKASEEHAGDPLRAVLETDWRELFPDEGLRDVIERALENNRDLRIAALNVERARAMFAIRQAELLPVAEGSVSYARERVSKDRSPAGTAATVEQYRVGLAMTAWELDFFGRIRNLKDSALEEYAAMKEVRRSAEILLVSEVATAWFSLAADRDSLALSRSTMRAREEAYEMIRVRHENGIASELDLQRARSQVESAKGDVALFIQRVAQGENALNLLAGSSLTTASMPSGMDAVAQTADIRPGLPSEALLSRPDVLAAEHRLKAAHANIGAARAAFFPRIILTSSLGTASHELSGLFESGSGMWSFAPRLSIPIFDGRVRPAYDVSKVERETALTEYEKTIQVAFRDVADALATRETLYERIEAQKALVAAAQEMQRITEARYNDGIDSYLSVLDAQRSLYGARQGLIRLEFEKARNGADFYRALGGWHRTAEDQGG